VGLISALRDVFQDVPEEAKKVKPIIQLQA